VSATFCTGPAACFMLTCVYAADTAPRIPPIAKHRQSMSLSYGPDAHVAASA